MADAKAAKSGDTVLVHYTGTLDSGQQFDSSAGRDPLEVTLGSGQVIAGFDTALTGMAKGETKTVRLAPDEAYGPHKPEMTKSVPRAELPEELDVRVGAMLQASTPDGHRLELIVREVNDDSVLLDANHPLAGRHLNFELTLVEIR